MNLIGALTYLVCKENNCPVLINKILANMSIKKKKLTKTYRAIKKKLEITTEICNSVAFIHHFTEKMNIPNCDFQIVQATFDDIEALLRNSLQVGKCPILFTTVCLFLTLSELHPLDVLVSKYAEVVCISSSNLKLKIKLYLKVMEEKGELKNFMNLSKLPDLKCLT